MIMRRGGDGRPQSSGLEVAPSMRSVPATSAHRGGAPMAKSLRLGHDQERVEKAISRNGVPGGGLNAERQGTRCSAVFAYVARGRHVVADGGGACRDAARGADAGLSEQSAA